LDLAGAIVALTSDRTASEAKQPGVTWMADKRYVMAVGSDDAGVHLKDYIKARLEEDPRVKEVRDFGVTDTSDATPYPIICIKVAEAVARGEHDRALLVCGTGLGMAITANKVPGVRAATAHDPYSAERARKSNDAQVLTMGARVIAPEAAEKVLDHWLASEFEGGRSTAKVDKMNQVDARYRDRRSAGG
jgi:ribose 5-phosphate isomerase B